ncbi:MAG: hypothetical protein ABI858_10140 [Pseudoxanthomonas sp.]
MIFRCIPLACLVLVMAACKPSTPADPAASNLSPASASAAGAGSALAPLASPKDEVAASMDKFMQAKTLHAVMKMEGAHDMTNEMDFVAPDRYRMKMQAGTQIIVGDTMYMHAQGRSMKIPLPKGTLSQWRDPLTLEKNKSGLSVEALGSDRVDGMPAKKFLVRNTLPEPSEFTLWIDDANGLPLKLLQQGQSQGKPYTMTLSYSRFNDPAISIETPQ